MEVNVARIDGMKEGGGVNFSLVHHSPCPYWVTFIVFVSRRSVCRYSYLLWCFLFVTSFLMSPFFFLLESQRLGVGLNEWKDGWEKGIRAHEPNAHDLDDV
jgi:hypothetical protein